MTAALLILFVLQAGPDFDYGKPSELRGLTKIYVYTDLDLKSREAITKEIAKQIPSLVIVDRREESELWLIYTQNTRRDFRGVIGDDRPNSSGGIDTTRTPIYRKTAVGAGYVVRPGTEGKRDRVLMDFHDERTNAFERKPTVNFARAFIKAYKEANK